MFDKLIAHRAANETRSITDLFDADGNRFEAFSVETEDMLLDYSKTALDAPARAMLLATMGERGVFAHRDRMFAGERINATENRAVLHTALRHRGQTPVISDEADVMPAVRETLARMSDFADKVRKGDFKGAGGTITDVVNIGIGGSDLGPAMAALALAPYHDGPRTHFISNVDSAHVTDVLRPLDPQRTLVIVASKTFTTIETMTNAATVLAWLKGGGGDPSGQFAALSSNLAKTAEFGIPDVRVFGFEDWVGGRYSVWGPIGLSLMLAIGPDDFLRFLDGGHAMDIHFRTAEPAQNMPVLLALIGLWHRNVCGYPSRAVLPYDQRLARLPAYLQQLDMESNGKRVGLDGAPLEMETGPIVWGEPGTNGQHAFYQLIHQGTSVVPTEFLVGAKSHEPDLEAHQNLLLANCLAQSEALMTGRDLTAAREIVAAKGISEDAEAQAGQRVFPGSRPSTTLIYRTLDPYTLGRIIALYEHRVFVEGAFWGINSFDQWGVELGKELATGLLPMIEAGEAAGKDGSTAGLIGRLAKLRRGS